ncbi:uncharacterized protein LOC126376818 [Pectinophora gossypiella]|uniref:uncharacterized protein LOC126376818 n=1 Tax=Pectinophora gossypiella TaxID=13191 RepID=UPI00214E34C8|nr:uncharacterized protein LOC126376818 [Pectinophora gossypiella]
MFIVLLILKILPASCLPGAEYQIFQGFDVRSWTDRQGHPRTPRTTTISLEVYELETTETPEATERPTQRSSTQKEITQYFYDVTDRPAKFSQRNSCPEEEKPINFGAYEVPTQRDLVFFTQKTLHRMFASYHQKAMLFLEDIRKATRATEQVASKCQGNKSTYRQCVRHVSNKCETITKSLTSALEQQRQDVLAFTDDTICNIESMKEDPVKLVKILASEEASLEFALPGFLRLLDACSAYCVRFPINGNTFKAMKPQRHLTDADIVIRHFLTRKHYKRLLGPEKNKTKKTVIMQFQVYQ